MAINETENEKSITSDYSSSRSKDSNSAKDDNNQENDNNNSSKSKAIDDLSTKLKQKKREVEQLGINPDDILEEEEKR
jgi:hypothetical protein